MSLIHEALRRADEDQRGQSAGVPASAPPVLPSDDPQTVPHGRSLWLVPLGAVLVILVGVATYAVWWGIGAAREQAGLAVRSAAAGLEKAAGTAVAESLAAAASGPAQSAAATDVTAAEAPTSAEETPVTLPDATAAAAETATGMQTSTAAASGPASETASERGANTGPTDTGEADLAGGWTPDLLLKPPAEGPTPAEQAAAGRPDPALLDRMLTVLEAAAREAARRQAEAAAGTPGTAATNAGTSGAGETEELSGSPETATASAGASSKTTPAKPAAKTPAAEAGPVIDTSQVKISSIMVGPHGGLAVINGRPVRVGDTILGATVVAITSRSVEVEKDGRRATIGL